MSTWPPQWFSCCRCSRREAIKQFYETDSSCSLPSISNTFEYFNNSFHKIPKKNAKLGSTLCVQQQKKLFCNFIQIQNSSLSLQMTGIYVSINLRNEVWGKINGGKCLHYYPNTKSFSHNSLRSEKKLCKLYAFQKYEGQIYFKFGQ